ncbi:MAG: HDIG domain-containing protein [Bacteroidales bacterium]|nr:HDIG domain-containing protein [Bacteroidales bacterium]MBD5377600.1 HDIG domain-containing protein [Bacteroides sp.]
MDFQAIIDKYYPAGTLRRDIFMKHSRQVALLALDIMRRKNLPLDPAMVEAAAMLHDIGVFMTHAPAIGCEGSHRYITHGVLGADLLRREGMPEEIARVAERHTGAGITAEDVEMLNLPIPVADYVPRTLLEKLVCYADKFYSKSGTMERKDFRTARASVARHGGNGLARFDEMARMFEE